MTLISHKYLQYSHKKRMGLEISEGPVSIDISLHWKDGGKILPDRRKDATDSLRSQKNGGTRPFFFFFSINIILFSRFSNLKITGSQGTYSLSPCDSTSISTVVAQCILWSCTRTDDAIDLYPAIDSTDKQVNIDIIRRKTQPLTFKYIASQYGRGNLPATYLCNKSRISLQVSVCPQSSITWIIRADSYLALGVPGGLATSLTSLGQFMHKCKIKFMLLALNDSRNTSFVTPRNASLSKSLCYAVHFNKSMAVGLVLHETYHSKAESTPM
jgi:hypothetical protein